jgi:hypothetical protein
MQIQSKSQEKDEVLGNGQEKIIREAAESNFFLLWLVLVFYHSPNKSPHTSALEHLCCISSQLGNLAWDR